MVEKAVGGHAVCHTCAAHCVALEDAEARNRELEAALREIADSYSEGQSPDANCLALAAREALGSAPSPVDARSEPPG